MSKNSQGLIDAVHSNDIKLVKSILASNPDDISQQDEHRNNALHIAAWLGNEPMVRLLIDHGVDTGRSNKDGMRPVDVARHFEHHNVIDAFLYPANSTLTDKIQIALAQALYVGVDGKVLTSSQIKNLEFVNQVMSALVDGNLSSNSKLADKIQKILLEPDAVSDPRLSALKFQIGGLVLSAEAKSNAARFSDEKHFGQKIKTQHGVNRVEQGDHFIKIADKKIGGDGGAEGGFVAVKRILRPSSLANDSKSGKYLNPWMIKQISQKNIGEDLVNSYVNYFGFEPKFRKITLAAKDKLGEYKRYIAVKYISNTTHPEELTEPKHGTKKSVINLKSRFGSKTKKKKIDPAANLVEYMFLVILLGYNDLNSKNILLQKNKINVIDWDVKRVKNSLTNPILQRYFDLLVEAINKGNFKEVKEILSFRKLKNIFVSITNIQTLDSDAKKIAAIKKLDKKTISFLELDKSNISAKIREVHNHISSLSILEGQNPNPPVINLLEQLLSSISDQEILSSIKRITDKDPAGLKAITKDFIKYGEVAPDQDPEVVTQKYKDYRHTVLKSLKAANSAVKVQFSKNPTPIKSLTKIKSSTKSSTIVFLDQKSDRSLMPKLYPIETSQMFKYLAGQCCFVNAIYKNGDVSHHYKGLVPKELLTNPNDVYKLPLQISIERIKAKPFDSDALQILSVAFPLFGYSKDLSLDGLLLQPRIVDEAKFKDGLQQYSDVMKKDICENMGFAIDALSEFAQKNKNPENRQKLLLLANRAEKCLEVFGGVEKQKEVISSIKVLLEEPPVKIKASSAKPVLGFVMNITDDNGRYVHNFIFKDDGKRNFCFVSNRKINNPNIAYNTALIATNQSLSELVVQESQRFETIKDKILEIEGGEKSFVALREALLKSGDDIDGVAKLILTFAIQNTQLSENSSRNVFDNISPQLVREFRELSAEIKKCNEAHGLFDEENEAGMGLESITTNSVRNYNPNVRQQKKFADRVSSRRSDNAADGGMLFF